MVSTEKEKPVGRVKEKEKVSDLPANVWQKSRHCTMGYAMSIDILEVHKSKNSLHAHFILKSIHSFFI